MVDTGNKEDPRLRPAPASNELGAARGEIFERGGYGVHPDRKLGQIVRRRPLGITGHQWSSASRTSLAFTAYRLSSDAVAFVVDLSDPVRRAADAERVARTTRAVCEAVGLELLRVESSALLGGAQGRRLLEYVIDARTFTDATADPADPGAVPTGAPIGYRDIIGRLPDGRSGFVNDLGAVARVAAVDAYASRQLTDPIIRGLHVCWKNGPAEGWAWLEVRNGLCIFERTRVWQHRFSCGVDPGRLAEDLAVAAIGERLKLLSTAEPELREKAWLGRALEDLRRHRDELENGFAFDHVSFD